MMMKKYNNLPFVYFKCICTHHEYKSVVKDPSHTANKQRQIGIFRITDMDLKRKDLGFTAHQEYFTHFEPSQSLSGRKREIREKNNHLTTRKKNLACPTCDPWYGRTHSGEMIERLRALISSGLNHSDTGCCRMIRC